MTRAAFLSTTLLLLVSTAGCGRAVTDDSLVRAINLDDGTIETFSNESEVPGGWGICSEEDCDVSSVPCQNLGEAVCNKNPACRLRTVNCTSSGSAGSGVPVQPMPGDSGGSDSGGGGAEPAPPPGGDMSDPAMTCEKVCVPEGALLCEELTDEQSCAARADCEWGEWYCPTMTCSSDDPNCATDPPICPASCHPTAPPLCGDLDKATCEARSDCTWEAGVCPAIYCEDPNDPVCKCEPFCRPADPTPPPTGCGDGNQCPAGEYCMFEEGCGVMADNAFAPDVKGVCAVMPDACPEIWGPVCGCDGKTYGNDCEAAASGVNVAHHGECDQPPPPTGSCSDNSQCAADHYCFFAKGCGMQAAPEPYPGSDMPVPVDAGVCEKRPDACFTLWAPVCGCDGKTYGNDCDAAANGVNVAYQGECV